MCLLNNFIVQCLLIVNNIIQETEVLIVSILWLSITVNVG